MKVFKTTSRQQIKAKSRKSILICFLLVAACTKSIPTVAQDRGFFNSIAIGASAGTTGIGFDVATPIGNYLALRAGISIMPDFKIKANDTDIDISRYDVEYPTTMDVEGSIKRTSGEILLNAYFSKTSKFFICAGCSFGGDRLVGIKAHTDNAELLELIRQGESAGIEVGDYSIPINENGDISGGLKAASLRPYLGLGMGRVVPKGRIGFTFEVGVQLQKSPKVYTDYGSLGNLAEEADNDFKDIMDIFSVYPVIKLRLCGRIF